MSSLSEIHTKLRTIAPCSDSCADILAIQPIVISNAYEYACIYNRLADLGYHIRDDWVKKFINNGSVAWLGLSDCVMTGFKRCRPQQVSKEQPPRKIRCTD